MKTVGQMMHEIEQARRRGWFERLSTAARRRFMHRSMSLEEVERYLENHPLDRERIARAQAKRQKKAKR